MKLHEPVRIKTDVGATGRTIRLQVIELADGTLGVSTTSQDRGKDIEGATVTVAGKLDHTTTATYKLENKVCTIESSSEGWINFTPDSDEVGTAGRLSCQIRVVISTLVEYTDTFYIDIETPIYYEAV